MGMASPSTRVDPMVSDKQICHTPKKGTTRIEGWKYRLIRKALLEVIPEGGQGLLFKGLSSKVAGRLSDDERARLGSVCWYTTTVKLDLEVKGVLRRLDNTSPQRLVRTTAHTKVSVGS